MREIATDHEFFFELIKSEADFTLAPVFGAREKVTITHITADQVYLIRKKDEDGLCIMCQKLEKYDKYNIEEPSKIPMEPGVFYAAKSKRCYSWFRYVD